MTATVDAPPPAAPPPPPPAPPPVEAQPPQPRRVRPPLPLWRLAVGVSALCLCGIALWSVVYVLFVSDLQHARAQHGLYAKFRSQLALAEAPIGGVIAPGKPVALLTIPAASLHGEVVVEGTTSGLMRVGPGHLRSSPLPGQAGQPTIYGRAVSFGAPFAKIGDLKPGDRITATTDQGIFHYRVVDVRHPGDRWTVPNSPSILTLATSRGGWMSDGITYVDSVLEGRPAPTPSGRLTTVSAAERLQARQTDSLTLVHLVLWLQLLAVVVVGVTWLGTKWGRWQVWVVAVPLLLAVLWGASNAASPLLPNLL